MSCAVAKSRVRGMASQLSATAYRSERKTNQPAWGAGRWRAGMDAAAAAAAAAAPASAADGVGGWGKQLSAYAASARQARPWMRCVRVATMPAEMVAAAAAVAVVVGTGVGVAAVVVVDVGSVVSVTLSVMKV